MRNLKEKRPELGGIFLMLRPPISSAFQVFSGGLMAVGRGASAIGATVDEGWFADRLRDDQYLRERRLLEVNKTELPVVWNSTRFLIAR